MTEQDTKDKAKKIREIYRYDEMSNKVLKLDRRFMNTSQNPQRDAEISQPKSMSGRISAKDMGNGVRSDTFEGIKKNDLMVDKTEKRASLKKIKQGNTILEASSDFRLHYYPKNSSNIEVYENILQWVAGILGNDIPHDLIVETADILIKMLKENEENTGGNFEKLNENIQNELGMHIESSSFTELVNLIRNITDYEADADDTNERAVAILVGNEDSDAEEDKLDNTNALGREIDEDKDDFEEANYGDVEANLKPRNNKALPNVENDTIELSDRKRANVETIPIYSVDEFFLQRKLRSELGYKDTSVIQELSEKILNEFKTLEHNPKALEHKLVGLLDFENIPLAEFIFKNRAAIFWGIRLAKSAENDIPDLIEEMAANGLDDLVKQHEFRNAPKTKRDLDSDNDESIFSAVKRTKFHSSPVIPPTVDLERIKFDESSKLMTVTKVSLPEGSFKRVKPQYDEIHIPAPKKPVIDYELTEITSLPDWCQEAFPSSETASLNPIQSKVFPAAFKGDSNLLICAPTGSGKTNIALLTVLKTLSHFYNPETKRLNLSAFKIVYIAPLKALVQEQVREFQRRLAFLGIRVAELTGDSRLSRKQIEETQILVSTPEKWDITTRNIKNLALVELVRLLIIDEIHLLHDERGPVLESIVARTFWASKYSQKNPRIIGLSATLPNYQDVGRFLRVPAEGLFYFDSSFRPCPLSQQFCGIKERNSLKKLKAMNDACYEKVLESINEGNQIIVFVHSRKETSRTATWLKNKFIEENLAHKLTKNDAGSKQILKTEAANIIDPSLRKLVEGGIGTHHAGLARNDRSLSEDLFADGLLQVLVCTATLAWGVNLPAHTVIIKGTDVYSPEKGSWEQLSPQDVLQMLGRAGRPRYDTFGEGVIITDQSNIQYYLSVLNQQLPIESQFVSKLVDNLNAEVVAGNIKCRKDAVNWLAYTYLYVRMLASPELYKVPDISKDRQLKYFSESLIHSALCVLKEQDLVLYDAENDVIEATDLGSIASAFYINHVSMDVYNKELNEHTTQIDLFRIFSMSEEFKYISVRYEEKRELKQLLEKAPIPIREDIDDPLAKVNVLLQSYFSQLKFEGFALNSDMVFIHQNAGRLLRAMFELCLKRGWGHPTRILLNLCKSSTTRMWATNSPLRQFKKCPIEVVKRLEASTVPWGDYLELETPAEVGRAIRSERHGKQVYDLLKRFPKISLKCNAQPITPSVIRFNVEILTNWIWDMNIHGTLQPFMLMLEDTDGDSILFHDVIFITPDMIKHEYTLSFTYELRQHDQKILPPNFFLTVISENWWHCECEIPVSFNNFKLPNKFPTSTPLLENIAVSTLELGSDDFSKIFEFETFNKIQSQVFETVYNSNDSVFVGAAKGSGKTTLAELALLNHWRQNKGRAVYINPSQKKIDIVLSDWNKRLSHIAGGKVVNKLGNDPSMNLKLLAGSHVLLATPTQFELLSRRWRQRKNIQSLELMIYDDTHEISQGVQGAVYETVISRMIFIATQLEKKTRSLCLSSCLANARDFGEWAGITKSNIYNFSPRERVDPLEINIQSFRDVEHISFNASMLQMAFEAVSAASVNDNSSSVFLPSRRDCMEVASAFMKFSKSTEWDMLNTEKEQVIAYAEKLSDSHLSVPLKHGIGIFYEGMSSNDQKTIEKLHEYGALSVLLISKDCSALAVKTNEIVVLGTNFYDGREHKYMPYTINELLEIVGLAKSNDITIGKVLILTSHNMKAYYKKFLIEPLPTESFLQYVIHDTLNNEIANSIIQSKQDCVDWFTYSYFYRRIHGNPSYYGVKDTSSYGISVFLTNLVESSLNDLAESSFIEIEDTETNAEVDGEDDENTEEISALNNGLIGSRYGVSFFTIQSLVSSLSNTSTLKNMLHLLSTAIEFENIPLRKGDGPLLTRLSKKLPLKFPGDIATESVSFKVFSLLQAYFSRVELPIDFQNDLRDILEKVVSLVNVIVDILSASGYLNATTAMDLAQMLIQGIWDVDNPLRQIPHFSNKMLEKCREMNVETVYDIMALEDEERDEILTLNNSQLAQVATFVNNYPNIELTCSLNDSDSLDSGVKQKVSIQLTRDFEPESLQVTSEKYPFDKLESWWLFLGDVSKKELYAIKRVTLNKEIQNYELEFNTPTAGKHNLTIWCVCDSYLDADKETSFEINVK
ncbi:brr2p [Saccharomyces arboricola H-6]|uniref:RNA helicase n=1 Tax=Saccharomyces arboricola (strain H-6 / AS 2.3317 / CBS 10644) TaxID=1160507 RepID=J8LPA2_SACAR|nr:brr2p [Saccharomyces arboricola H-6]